MSKWKISLFVLLIFLVACSNNVVDEARKTQGSNDRVVEKEEKQKESEIENNQEIYEELEKPIEEVIEENELEQRDIIDSDNVVVKESYSDPDEFAAFLAEILFKFQNGEVTPEEYYDFLIKYGSEELKETLPEDSEIGVAVYSSIQELFKNASANSYLVSNVGLNESRLEGYFYRQLKKGVTNEYYITTIVKEKEGWKYKDDSPSPPFEINESLQGGENKNVE